MTDRRAVEVARRQGAADAVVLALAHRLFRPFTTLADAARALGLSDREVQEAVKRFKGERNTQIPKARRAQSPGSPTAGTSTPRGAACPNDECEAQLGGPHNVEVCARRSPIERVAKQIYSLRATARNRPLTGEEEAKLARLVARRDELRRSAA